jgi:hypothetical protein
MPRAAPALLDHDRAPAAARSPHHVHVTNTSTPFDTSHLVLPELDPADIARLDALLADIEARRDLLRTQDEALNEIHRLTVAGFADSTLAIDRPQTRQQ